MASLTGVAQSIGVKSVGIDVVLPQNDVAYLMYYLNCVLKGCGLDIIQDDLVDYRNYHRLSSERQDQVFLAAYKYSPDELIDKTIFLDSDGSVCGTDQNVFLQISEDLKVVHAQAQVLIVGEQKKVASIMVFRMHWIDKFYKEPMKRNLLRLKRALIATVSNHCEHCAGRCGTCKCRKCPRTSQSKCSQTLALSGLMGALSEALDDAKANIDAQKDHCTHCKGLKAACGCEEGCTKPAKACCIVVHKGILCDACRKDKIVGARYKCAQCDNYDLCQECYKGNRHELSHNFHLIERVGAEWRRLEPRVPAKPKQLERAPQTPQSKPLAKESDRGPERRGFFYEDMSVAEMKEYLKENDVPSTDVFEVEDLRRRVWECYCDSVSAKELAQIVQDTGIDVSRCRGISSRRSVVKSGFRVAERPKQPVASTPQASGNQNPFCKDQRVILCGLKKDDLNGKKGRVVDPDSMPGRVDIVLDENSRSYRVKYENVTVEVELVD